MACFPLDKLAARIRKSFPNAMVKYLTYVDIGDAKGSFPTIEITLCDRRLVVSWSFKDSFLVSHGDPEVNARIHEEDDWDPIITMAAVEQFLLNPIDVGNPLGIDRSDKDHEL